MTDEEKEAILELKHFSNMTAYWKQEEYSNSQIDSYIKIVLNLIEKQQKEIKELKEIDIRKDGLVANFSTRHFKDREKIRNSISKNKIREKIKELEDNKKIQLLNKPSVVKQICLSTFRELLEEKNDE